MSAPPTVPVRSRVVVVGSANLDLVHRVVRLPAPGETVLATAVDRHPGGKGNNQIIAAARAGAAAALIAALGTDDNAEPLVGALDDAGVEHHLRRTDVPTGTALITVDDRAENTIVVDSGANGALVDLTADELAIVAGSTVLLMQLETPLATVVAAAVAARDGGVTVLLNAAPARALPDELVAALDVLIVNEIESAAVGGPTLTAVPTVVTTLGARGAIVRHDGVETTIAAPVVDAIDTTGAGDTFCGVFAAALADGQDVVAATRLAVAAASLSVQRPGAVPSIPNRAEIDAALDRLPPT